MRKQTLPTKSEKKIIQLCLKNQIPFVYTGNYVLFLNGRNPDFKHLYLPLLIEYYHTQYKPIDYEIKRNNVFLPLGYKVLYITESDFSKKDYETTLLNKIKFFVETNNTMQDPLLTENNFNFFLSSKMDEDFIFSTLRGKVAMKIVDYLKKENKTLFSKEEILVEMLQYSKYVVGRSLKLMQYSNIISMFRDSTGIYIKVKDLNQNLLNVLSNDLRKKPTILKKDFIIQTRPGQRAKEILDFLNNNYIFEFKRKLLKNNNLSEPWDTTTRALNLLVKYNFLLKENSGTNTKYHLKTTEVDFCSLLIK